MFLYYAQNVWVRTISSFAAALNGFRVLPFVPPASEVLAELKRTTYNTFFPLIIQLEIPHIGAGSPRFEMPPMIKRMTTKLID